jgi:hypothetical protein
MGCIDAIAVWSNDQKRVTLSTARQGAKASISWLPWLANEREAAIESSRRGKEALGA